MLSLAFALLAACPAPSPVDPPRLLDYPALYAVVGQELAIQVDNLPCGWQGAGAPWTIAISGPAGAVEGDSWSWVPSVAGSYSTTITASYGGVVLDTVSTSTIVSAATIASGSKVLVVGDSTTANNYFPVYLAAMAGANATFLGTQTNGGVSHEGWGSKFWCWFSAYADSPMTSALNVIDIPAYLTAIGATPDVVIWRLGINGLTQCAASGVPACAAAELSCADTLLAAWAAAAPSAVHAIQLVKEGAASDAAWVAGQSPPYNSQWWERQKYRGMSEAMIAHWAGDGTGGIYLYPAELAVDRADHYGASDPLHPLAAGYLDEARGNYAVLAFLR